MGDGMGDGKRVGHDALAFLLENCVQWDVVERDSKYVVIEYQLYISPERRRLQIPVWKFDSVTARQR